MSPRPADPTLLGTVEDVTGATVTVALEKEAVAGLAFVRGVGYRIGQVGSFVRIPIGFIDLFGVVSQVGAGAAPPSLAESEPYGRRWMTVQLVGEGEDRGDFRRGISQYPTVGDTVHLVTEEDLAAIYGQPDSPDFVNVGQVASNESIPALLDITKLVTRHSAILGTTGAGKSTTVASLLNSLASHLYPSARILVLDLHGEYRKALEHKAQVFAVGAEPNSGQEPLYIPYWALTFDELLTITLGELDDSARVAVLEKVTELKAASLDKQPRAGVTKDNLTVDSPVPFSLHKLWLDLHRLVNATHHTAGGQSVATEALELDGSNQPIQPGNAMKVIPPRYIPQTQEAGQTKIFLSSSPLNIGRQLHALAGRLRDPRFSFLFSPGPWCPDEDGLPEKDLDALLQLWIGGEQPIAVLDLSAVPFSILTDLVGVLLRIVLDALLWARDLSEGGRERPLLVVLEEAHAYLGRDASGPATESVKRIVKEGRKYGVGAMIVSQRPAEIDATILSQCGTLFAMRLANSVDRNQVVSAAPDFLEGLFAMLPALRTGEAIIVGEAVRLPMRTLISPPPAERRPDSEDPLVVNDRGPGGWNREREPTDYADVLEVWRKQDRRSGRLVPQDSANDEREDK